MAGLVILFCDCQSQATATSVTVSVNRACSEKSSQPHQASIEVL